MGRYLWLCMLWSAFSVSQAQDLRMGSGVHSEALSERITTEFFNEMMAQAAQEKISEQEVTKRFIQKIQSYKKDIKEAFIKDCVLEFKNPKENCLCAAQQFDLQKLITLIEKQMTYPEDDFSKEALALELHFKQELRHCGVTME